MSDRQHPGEPTDLASWRAHLEVRGLEVAEVDEDPLVTFDAWFYLARRAGVYQPEAMTVATVSAAGVPSVRHVLLRGRAPGVLRFFTNYRSAKAQELDANPAVALCFGWIVIGRQVRVVGRATRSIPEVSDAYFATRPRDSQLGAWASAQSQVLADRAELDEAYGQAQARFDGVPVPRPPHWGGFDVVADQVELWQGRGSRLHDRVLCTRRPDGTWSRQRLAP